MTRLLGDIGTIEWCRQTEGLMTRRERLRYLAAVVGTTTRLAPRMAAARLGMRGSGPDPSAVVVPDTAFALDLLDACAHLPAMLVHHGIRSFRYATALGEADHIDADPEALFAAALLHDVAFPLTDELTDRCFTLAGAEVAEDLLATSPLGDDQRHAVLDAITLHLNPTVPTEQGSVPHLVHDGVLVDVLGARAWHLDPAGTRAVAEAHPREGFLLDGEAKLRAYGRRVAGCRSRCLFTAGFASAMRLGPWRPLERAERAARTAPAGR
jgi:hypothetical protein